MKTKSIEQLLHFLNNSPTAWHAVANTKKELLKNGFKELSEEESWKLKLGHKYFVIRNGSSLCAFTLPKKTPKKFKIAASHTDSPSLKLKPNATFTKENMIMLGTEIYGAPLLTSWLNRDLAIAGRIICTDAKGTTQEKLVYIDNHPVIVPQLAIHLDRNVNESGPVLNKQEHLAAVAGITNKKENGDFLEKILKTAVPFKNLLPYDLFLVPIELARLLGGHGELISSYRIDSLVSVYAILQGFLEKSGNEGETVRMITFWDSEEIGSTTAQGAGSPFLEQTLERICLSLNLTREEYFQIIHRSLCASVDLGHALHPNYADKHDPRHTVLMNQGVILKVNAQNRYASDARSSAEIVKLCDEHNIPLQKYVSRGDIPCGSTVGPIHSQQTGMATVDIGISQLSMHSARELVGTDDYLSLTSLLTLFLS
ncbi:MAG: M18 family aminopeptidase [Parachlamydiaceae bacterium]